MFDNYAYEERNYNNYDFKKIFSYYFLILELLV